jgi:hypothetical protein
MRNRRRTKVTLTAVALLGLVLTVVPEALAVVGRPATPVSYAGAARRTVRRGG